MYGKNCKLWESVCLKDFVLGSCVSIWSFILGNKYSFCGGLVYFGRINILFGLGISPEHPPAYKNKPSSHS